LGGGGRSGGMKGYLKDSGDDGEPGEEGEEGVRGWRARVTMSLNLPNSFNGKARRPD